MTMEKIGIIGFTSEEERDYYRRMLTALGVQEQILFGEVLTRISLREHAKIMRFSEHSSLRSMVCEAEPHRDWLKKEAERMLDFDCCEQIFVASSE